MRMYTYRPVNKGTPSIVARTKLCPHYRARPSMVSVYSTAGVTGPRVPLLYLRGQLHSIMLTNGKLAPFITMGVCKIIGVRCERCQANKHAGVQHNNHDQHATLVV